ncbi:hypothetical protein GOBAR_DD11274 [Gossypium barbadense]|nr:hypothetical protein GOBAR_DD11274 [Gossypium barbadense]
MKIGMDMFMRSQEGQSIEWPERSSDSSKCNEEVIKLQEEEDEETDDEATEDNNFKSYKGNFKSSFASTIQPRGGLVFRELSDRSWMPSSRPTVKGKGKRITGPSEGP